MGMRINLPSLVSVLLFSGTAFVLGFAFSRYVIDRELRESDAAVLQSARGLEDLETVMAQQFPTHYQLLEVKVKAIESKKEQH